MVAVQREKQKKNPKIKVSYDISCFSVKWAKLRSPVSVKCSKFNSVKHPMYSRINITIKICCVRAAALDREDDSRRSGNKDRTLERGQRLSSCSW